MLFRSLAGLDVADLPHGDSGEVAGAQVGVDTHHEQSQVAWLARQELFDRADMLDVTDGVNGDYCAFWGVIRVGHNSPYFANLYKYYRKKLVSCQGRAKRDGQQIEGRGTTFHFPHRGIPSNCLAFLVSA